jgi:hypothetical protein
MTFFKTNKKGILRCLPRNAPFSLIMTAESTTLKLDNQKNGWKGVCVHQEANGEAFNCPVKALARQVIHLRKNGRYNKALLSAFYLDRTHYDVAGEDISKGLKMAEMLLHYPETRGIPIEHIDMHSLQGSGANLWHCQATPTCRSKKWAGGRVLLSRSILGKNLHVTLQECHQT